MITDFGEWLKRYVYHSYILLSLFIIVLGQLAANSVSHIRPLALSFASTGGYLSMQFIDEYYNFKNYINDVMFVYRENQELNEQIDNMKQNYLYSQFVHNENQELKQLLKVPNLKFDTITSARIIVDASNSKSHRVLLAAGQKQGVNEGFVAVNSQGVVGLVTHSEPNFSELTLITSPDLNIPVQTEFLNLHAIARGNNSSSLELDFLPHDIDLNAGEIIFTSGDGKLYPEGLVVGVVEKDEVAYNVKPLIRWNQVNWVKIIGRQQFS